MTKDAFETRTVNKSTTANGKIIVDRRYKLPFYNFLCLVIAVILHSGHWAIIGRKNCLDSLLCFLQLHRLLLTVPSFQFNLGKFLSLAASHVHQCGSCV